jgi:hypothetical protein
MTPVPTTVWMTFKASPHSAHRVAGRRGWGVGLVPHSERGGDEDRTLHENTRDERQRQHGLPRVG